MQKEALAVLVLASALGFSVSAARSQDASGKDSPTLTDRDVQLLRQDVRSNKKQLVAANLTLTDGEATKCWPVYDQYGAEMTKLGDQKYALVKEYAQNFGSLSDAHHLYLPRAELFAHLAEPTRHFRSRSSRPPVLLRAVRHESCNCLAPRQPPSSRSTDVSPG